MCRWELLGYFPFCPLPSSPPPPLRGDTGLCHQFPNTHCRFHIYPTSSHHRQRNDNRTTAAAKTPSEAVDLTSLTYSSRSSARYPQQRTARGLPSSVHATSSSTGLAAPAILRELCLLALPPECRLSRWSRRLHGSAGALPCWLSWMRLLHSVSESLLGRQQRTTRRTRGTLRMTEKKRRATARW